MGVCQQVHRCPRPLGVHMCVRGAACRRSAQELEVLQGAYSSWVAAPEQQRQQQEAGTIQEEGSGGSVAAPADACPLSHVEELLQPMVRQG